MSGEDAHLEAAFEDRMSGLVDFQLDDAEHDYWDTYEEENDEGQH